MKLFFREFGKGTPLIILHGLYGSSDNWVGIARELSDTFRVIIPDLRNHGRSPHNPVHTYEAISDDLLELADSLDLGKFILAGHSMGGKAAVYFSARWPDRISGLIVLDISPFSSGTGRSTNYKMHLNIMNLMNSEDPPMFRNREEAVNIFSKSIQSKQIIGFLMKNLTRSRDGSYRWKLNPGYLLDNIENIMDGFDRNRVSETEVHGFPVLFIRAEKSGYISDLDMVDIPRLFPAAEITTIKNTSHWLHAEEPEMILRLIREFAS